MAWYDLFASFYDASLEKLYAPAREHAARRLALEPGMTVLDVPCGTGASLRHLGAAMGGRGTYVGADASEGMLRRAQRAHASDTQDSLLCTHWLQCDVHTLDQDALQLAIGRPQVDRLLVFLGLSTFPEWERAFDRLFALVREGGVIVVADVHAPTLSMQGRMVNWIAQADIRRETWRPLERLCVDVQRTIEPPRREYGGELFIASGRKPSAGG